MSTNDDSKTDNDEKPCPSGQDVRIIPPGEVSLLVSGGALGLALGFALGALFGARSSR